MAPHRTTSLANQNIIFDSTYLCTYTACQRHYLLVAGTILLADSAHSTPCCDRTKHHCTARDFSLLYPTSVSDGEVATTMAPGGVNAARTVFGTYLERYGADMQWPTSHSRSSDEAWLTEATCLRNSWLGSFPMLGLWLV